MKYKMLLCTNLFLCGILAAQTGSAIKPAAKSHQPAAIQHPAPLTGTAKPDTYIPEQFPRRAREFYASMWGIDSLGVKYAESGELLRFNYRILDAAKAAPLNDKKLAPALIAPRAGVKLTIPSLEKVGQLRQNSTPEPGQVYWMAFSNKGRPVRPGDRVNIVIGNFHADNLLVQ